MSHFVALQKKKKKAFLLYAILYRLLNVISQLLLHYVMLGMRFTNFFIVDNTFLTELSLGLCKSCVVFLWYIVTSFSYVCFRFANDYDRLWVLLELYFVKCFL